MGFTFDDDTQETAANRLSLMEQLVAHDNPSGKHNAKRIRPFLGGDEVNDSPTQAHRRYVIDFGDFPLQRHDEIRPNWNNATPEQRAAYLTAGTVPIDYPHPVAADWPELLTIVKTRVKPERDRQGREIRKRYWWKFAERAPALYESISSLDKCFVVNCGASPHFAPVLVNANQVFSNTLDVFCTSKFQFFAVLQSRAHEIWARKFSGTMKDDLRYSPSDCLENFPFPLWDGKIDTILMVVGHAFHGRQSSTNDQRERGSHRNA